MHDAIVIGSGAGGLTAALALARAGQRVLVLEQHYLPGGWCHSFNLGGYRFSPGVHYIGECDEGGRMRQIYEGLGVSEHLEFFELNPDGFDRMVIGDRTFDIPRGYEAFVDRLCATFPAEADGIRSYMGTIRRLQSQLDGAANIESVGDALKVLPGMGTTARWAWRPLSSLMDTYIRNPELRAILTFQAGDHGLPASRCPAGLHAAVTGHYFQGGFYPKGGGRSLPRAFLKELRKHGGDIRLRARVDEILVEQGRVAGVRLDDGEELRATTVVSNADPMVTWGKLMPASHTPRAVTARLKRTTWSCTAISVFMAIDADARALGLSSANLWIARDAAAVNQMLDDRVRPDPLHTGEVGAAFLTCTTLKDPTKLARGHHVLEAFTFVGWDEYQQWSHGGHGDRPSGYAQAKERLAEMVIKRVEQAVPGLSDHLVFQEVGTPLTNQFYVNSTRGNLYGTEKRISQLVPPMNWDVRTSVPGLFQCGASTVGHGVAGATISGLMAARSILNCRMADILNGGGPALRIHPAEPGTTGTRAVAK